MVYKKGSFQCYRFIYGITEQSIHSGNWYEEKQRPDEPKRGDVLRTVVLHGLIWCGWNNSRRTSLSSNAEVNFFLDKFSILPNLTMTLFQNPVLI